MSLGGLKYPLPPMTFLLPSPKFLEAKFLEKYGIFEDNFDFFGLKMPFFQKNFGTSRDFQKYVVKFKKDFNPPPLKNFPYPYPPPKIFDQAHVCT
jgi:hypothetical protein